MYEPKPDHVREITPVIGPTRVKQSFSDEVNINKIMAKYTRTGVVPQINLKKPLYGDFSNVQDYLSAVSKVRESEAAFMSLPAEVRARTENDPGKFLEWVTNEDNKAEIVGFGLASQEAADLMWPPPPEPEPDPAPPEG